MSERELLCAILSLGAHRKHCIGPYKMLLRMKNQKIQIVKLLIYHLIFNPNVINCG